MISVSGVGPKAAVSILSEMNADKLALAVAAGDVKAITKAVSYTHLDVYKRQV